METPEQLLLQATRCLQQGRFEEGIAVHQRLLALRPDLADSWFNLGWMQRVSRRFDEALESYQQALDRGMRQPEEAHINRAAILSEHLDRVAEAEAELGKAIALNPGHIVARLNLGNLYEDLGDVARARAAYRAVLEIAPSNGRALARLAAIDVHQGQAEATIPALHAALDRPGLLPADAADIQFALGNALDATGAHDEAFAAFVAANRASRDSAPPPGPAYDRAAQERLIDALIRAFPEPAAADPAASGGKPPIFVLGMFRSGSTLAEQILARHSRVTAGGELDLLPALVQLYLQPYPEAAASADAALHARLREAYLDNARALHPWADVLTDKRPDNFLHVGLIKRIFPDARIVHTRRHPLDNILSVYFLHFEHSQTYGLELTDAAHWYIQYARLMAHWQRLYPDDLFDFDYDAVVAEPRPLIARLADFCGLAWEEDMLTPEARDGVVRSASVWQVRQKLHQRSSGRWRHYEKHLGEAKRMLEQAGLI